MTTDVITRTPDAVSAGEFAARRPLSEPERIWATDRTMRVTVAVAFFFVGLKASISFNVTSGLVASLVLLPLWISAPRYFKGGRALISLGFLAEISGLVLAMTASIDHSVNIRNAVDVALQLLTALFAIGLIFWARRVAPIHRIAFYYGLGSLIGGFGTLSGSTNAWKYQLATPLTIMVLSWVAQRRADSPWPAVGALSLMGAISIVYDYRSNFGMCVVAALLVLWYSRKPKRSRRRLGAISVAALLGVAMVAVYYAGTALIVHGYLGKKLQVRSVAQIQASGSLIAGGRPEWFGTFGLMQERPTGFGVGVVPLPSDVHHAERGLATVGLPPGSGYITHFMFNGQIKLHSVVADLWSNFGILGLVFAGYLLWRLLTALFVTFTKAPSALLAFLAMLAVWDLAFGPIYSNLPEIALAAGLMLLEKPLRRRRTLATAPAR